MIFNRAKPRRQGDVGPLRVNELTRLCRDRYPTGTITPDDQGRALLDAIIKHMIFFCEERIVSFAATWANWMTPEGLAKIIDEAKIERRKIYAEEAGRMVNLRCDERRRLRITTMRPADKSAAEFRNGQPRGKGWGTENANAAVVMPTKLLPLAANTNFLSATGRSTFV